MSAHRTRTCPRRDTTPMRRRLPSTVTIDRAFLSALTKLAKRNLEDLDDHDRDLIIRARSIVRGDHETPTQSTPGTREPRP